MFDVALLHQCAPHVPPRTMVAIIRTESGFNPLALHVNGTFRLASAPRSAAEAASWTRWLISRGYSVDMGLMQINSRNLGSLNMTPEDAFDPCRNLWGGARILTSNYVKAESEGLGENALLAAISAYNTGNFRAGFSNGYVARVVSNAPRSQSQSRSRESDSESQICWLSSCTTVNLSRVGLRLMMVGGALAAGFIGYLFGVYQRVWQSICAGLQAL
jgi:type IV secretion system protein VirB1